MGINVNRNQLEIIIYLFRNPSSTLGEVSKYTGLRKGTLFNDSLELIHAGLVIRNGKKYSLAKKTPSRVKADYRDPSEKPDATPMTAYDEWLRTNDVVYVGDREGRVLPVNGGAGAILASKPWTLMDTNGKRFNVGARF